MLKLIIRGGDVIAGETKEELEINMKNDNVFTQEETIEEYKKGVCDRVFQMYGYIIDQNNFIDSLIEHGLARLEETPTS